MLARRPDARLVLVGAVYEPRWLHGLLREAGAHVSDRVVLAGEQPQRVVAAAYHAASVFAFPSCTDTQALVLQEAALAGRPVVMVDPVLHAAGPLRGRAVLAAADPDAFGDAVADLLDDGAGPARSPPPPPDRAASHTPARYAAAVHEAYEHARARTRPLAAA